MWISNANGRIYLGTFLGPRNQSPAKKGRCTDTGGYISDFEIGEIIEKGGAIKSWYDEETDSDYLVYEQTEWVAYMTKTTKERRMGEYQDLNFGGTTDWAVDLQDDTGGSDGDGDQIYIDESVYDEGEMQCHAPCSIILPPSPLPSMTTITVPAFTTSLLVGRTTTTVTITPAPITTDVMEFYNVDVPSTEPSQVQPYPSIRVEDAEIAVSYVVTGETTTTTRTIALPPWPAINQGPVGDDWNAMFELTSTFDPIFTMASLPPEPERETITYTAWENIAARINPVPEVIEDPRPDEKDDDDDDGPLVALIPCSWWFFSVRHTLSLIV